MKNYRELLLVTAVFGILLVLAHAAVDLGAAKSTQCQSNLKQFGDALQMYRDDYDNFNCYSYIENYSYKGHRLTFYQMLAPYLGCTDLQGPFLRQYANTANKVNQLFICPETVLESNRSEGGWRSSYMANSTYPENSNPHACYFGGQGFGDSVKFDRVKKPAEVGAIFDRNQSKQRPDFCVSWHKKVVDANELKKTFPQRHNGKDNVLFFDGHVDAVAINVPFNKWLPIFGLNGISK